MRFRKCTVHLEEFYFLRKWKTDSQVASAYALWVRISANSSAFIFATLIEAGDWGSA